LLQAAGHAESEALLLQHLLHLALRLQRQGFEHALNLLLQRPTAVQLPPSVLQQLLTAVLQADFGHLKSRIVHHIQGVMRDVCRLPGAAAAADEAGALHLLHVSIECKPLLLPYMLRLPFVQQLQPQSVLKLLQLTVASGSNTTDSSSSHGYSRSNVCRVSCVQQLLQLMPVPQGLTQRRYQDPPSPSITPGRLAMPRFDMGPVWGFRGFNCI
jgi:hypothetical protein